MKKLRVGVFMGGKSVEREVSFNSGRTVCDHLDTQRYEILPIFQTADGLLYILPWRFLHRGKISDFAHRLAYEARQITWSELKKFVDFLYLAVHGRFAEDGTLQGMLEILKIPYLGSKVFSSALVMDKIIQRDFLKSHDISITKAIIVTPNEIINFEKHKDDIFKKLQEEQINFPFIVKPHKEGSSLGTSCIFNKDELLPALKKACFVYEKHQSVLIEEKIEGLEFTSLIIIDKNGEPLALPPTEIVKEQGSHFFDYEQKYMPGRATKITPARCSKEEIKKIQQTSIKAMQALEIKTIARIDGFLKNNGEVVIFDPNTLSGMTPSSFIFRQAAETGMSHTQLINHLIESELKNYGIDTISTINSKDQNMNIQKIKVAVLFGGNSNEKETSLDSGRNIVYKLSPNKYQVMPIFINNSMEFYAIPQQLLVRNSTKEIELGLQPDMKIDWSDLPKMADFVFIALHGGYGENGCIQGALEMIGLPYNGSSVFTSSLCMDKYKTNQFLKFKGLQVPENVFVSKKDWIQDKEQIINKINDLIDFPIIVKPHDDGCSVLVQKVGNNEELKNSIEKLFNNEKDFALIEECITGMELTVGVIGNDNPIALPPSQAIALKGVLSIEEKFLPGEGENQTPAPLSRDATNLVKKTMEEAYKFVGCKGYARIDCFYQSAEISPTKQDRVVIIEINTLPGMTPATCIFHQAAEMDIKPMDFIDLIISLGFEEHQISNPMLKTEETMSQLISKLNLSKFNIKNL